MTLTASELQATPFEVLYEQWYPKIVRMSQQFVPYLGTEDLRQELAEVLWKCQKRFRDDAGASFHTYLHTAMQRRLWTLSSQVKKHNPSYSDLLYLGTYHAPPEEEDSQVAWGQLAEALKEEPEDSARVYLQVMGFTSLEVAWTLMGRVNSLRYVEIARLLKVDEDSVRQAAKTAKRKLKVLSGMREEDLCLRS